MYVPVREPASWACQSSGEAVVGLMKISILRNVHDTVSAYQYRTAALVGQRVWIHAPILQAVCGANLERADPRGSRGSPCCHGIPSIPWVPTVARGPRCLVQADVQAGVQVDYSPKGF